MKVTARGVLFDLDGTIYEGNRLLDGSLAALAFCQGQGIPYRFVTNTTSRPRVEVATRLREFGIDAREDWIFTAPAAAREVLLERRLIRCFFLLRSALAADLQGLERVEDSPQAVVIGDLGEEFSYEKLNRAFQFLLDEQCAFITLARNRYFKTADGLKLDVGAFVAGLEYATGRTGELVGKPAESFFRAAAASLQLPPEQVVVVGDDLESDVLGAQAAGLKGVLVRTGKFRQEQLDRAEGRPDAVWDSLGDLPKSLSPA